MNVGRKIWRNVVQLLLAVGLIVLMRDFKQRLWNDYVGNKLFGKIDSSVLNDILVVLYVVLSLLFLVGCRDKLDIWRKSESHHKLLLYLYIGFVILYIYSRCTQTDIFTAFSGYQYIKYSDLFVCAFVGFGIWFILGITENGNTIEQSHDVKLEIFSDEVDCDDLLNKKSEVRKLVEHLIDNPCSKSAIGVAVTGSWGTGKSWFLNNMYHEVCMEKRDAFFFHPWKCVNGNVIDAFFNTLEPMLSGDKRLFHRYVMKIKQSGDISIMSLLTFFFQRLFGSNSLDITFEAVRENLQKNGRQIFVFIDDVDRLERDDIKLVLSLIRNVADLPYLVFVLAFDEVYVNNQLKDIGGREFVKKMINIYHPLQPVSGDILGKLICNSLKKYGLKQDPFKFINVQKYLPTLREVKTYMNLLIKDLKVNRNLRRKAYINMEDYVLLKLLKYYDYDSFSMISTDCKFFDTVFRPSQCAPFYCLNEKIPSSCADSSRDIISVLFGGSDRRKSYSIASIVCFQYYFIQELPSEHITIQEFEDALLRGNLKKCVCQWIRDGKENVLVLLSCYYHKLARFELWDLLELYIYYECERLDSMRDLSDLLEGFSGKDKLHMYSSIKKIIDIQPSLVEMAFQCATDFGEENGLLEEHANATLYKLEMMALLNALIRYLSNEDCAYQDAKATFYKLWESYIMPTETWDAITANNVLQLLKDCQLPDVEERAIISLLNANLEFWLGTTLICISDNDVKYLIVSHEKLCALFDTYSKFKEICSKLYTVKKTRLLAEFYRLVTNMTNKVNLPGSYLITKYPLLAKLPRLGQERFKPFEAIDFSQEFWSQDSLRKEENDRFYFD